ncbi:hypothetical protein IKD56_00840 [bacterium]|nr:hypothetical protein [bacterium]
MKKYVADFETCTWLPDETFVWAWAVSEIGNPENLKFGNSIESFIEFLENSNNSSIYFHNLKFDSEFIIYYLLKNGYKHITDKKDCETKTFTTLISDMGMFYSLEIYFYRKNKNVKKVKIFDSLKIIPFSVSEIAKAFNLEESKLSIDYNEVREKGHILTNEEKEYIKNDVVIVAKALDVLFKEGLEKMTQGSNALSDFKEMYDKSKYKHLFPHLDYDIDKDLRKAYKGGFTYLNPIYEEINVGEGVVLDVNSLYPYVMNDRLMPFGEPIFFDGKYTEDIIYPLYIQMITCRFKIKEGKIPTIQIKNSMFKFRPNEYLESSGENIVCLTLTNIDLKLFFEQYDVFELKFECGWKFKGKHHIFDEYISKWYERKKKASIEKNKGQRTLAKLMLNSLYGKFATSLDATSKIPYLEDDIVHYKLGEKEEKEGLYIPIGAFITSYARELTIRTSQAIKDYSLSKYGKDMYIYSDTDSIHTLLPIEELKLFCDIDPERLRSLEA